MRISDDTGSATDEFLIPQTTVFISHASEDKESLVRELALCLNNQGLNVWFDEFSLRLGDPLRESIDKGLAESDYGVIVLSKAFFSKKWTRDELEGLFSREVQTKRNLIIPVWHGVGFNEVADHSPIIASRIAADSQHGVDSVAMQIANTIRERNKDRDVVSATIRSPGGGEARITATTNANGEISGFDLESIRRTVKSSSELFKNLLVKRLK